MAQSYQQFAAIEEFGPGGHVLRVFGDVDFPNAPAFEAAVREVSAAVRDVLTIDLTECRYFDSSGITVLVRAHKTLGHRMRLLVLRDSIVFRIMQIANLDRLFTVVSALQQRSAMKETRLVAEIEADRSLHS
jgi:anti-sigma B factor antagonist